MNYNLTFCICADNKIILEDLTFFFFAVIQLCVCVFTFSLSQVLDC